MSDIYTEYKIPLNLQLHQLRVAAVAQQTCESLSVPVDAKNVITACLLHDMGNIIKFRLRVFPELMKDQTIEYWEEVQKEYIEKYGMDEHHATILIAKELGVDEAILRIMDAIEFHNWRQTSENGSWEQKIATYADSRVAPHGVVSLDGRLEDAVQRYKGTDRSMDEVRDTHFRCIRDIEKQIFSGARIKSEDITDESIKDIMQDLKNFCLEI